MMKIPNPLTPASLCLMCWGWFLSSAPAAVIVTLDLSTAPGVTVGDQLVANQVANVATDSGTSFATFDLNYLLSVDMTLAYTGEGAAGTPDYPRLRSFAAGGLAIDSSLAASQDNSTGLDERYGDSRVDETLTFTFSQELNIKQLGLNSFDFENIGSGDIYDVFGITANGFTTLVTSTDANVTDGTVNGDSVKIITFAEPIRIHAGQDITFFVADNGDPTTKAVVGLQSILLETYAIPEPSSAFLMVWGSLFFWRSRRKTVVIPSA